MPNTVTRLQMIPNSAISQMARLAEQHHAISLAQGVPDFDPPAELIKAAEDALHGGYNQYSSTWGSPRLRQALAHKHSLFSGLPIDPDREVTVTVGGTEALLASLASVTEPGERVLVFSPHYEAYIVDSHLLGAVPIHIPLHPPELTFDPDDLRREFEAGARVIVLCNPANPTGKVFSLAELHTIASLAQEYSAFVLADEIYEHITYAPYQHTYISSLDGMFERTISCSSLSKTYAATGWRVGWAIAPPEITSGLRKIHDFLAVCAPTPLQEASVTALQLPLSYYTELQALYTQRRDIFLASLDQTGLSYIHPQGAYYVLVDISPFGFEDDYTFCTWMIQAVGVAATPGSYFFHEPIKNYIRFNFAKREDTLKEVGERISRLADLA
jgi:aminotransferase